MKVTYDSSLWNKGRGLPGLRQRTDWNFEFEGTKRCIPAVYRFSRGIVFDVIAFLDETKVREYFGKYGQLEEKLSPVQRRIAIQEHPYQTIPVRDVWINGRKVREGYSSSSNLYIPWMDHGYDLIPIRKAYAYVLHDTACFGVERYCVPYPEAGSGGERLLRSLGLVKVKELKLVTYPVQRFYPLNIQFDMSPDDKHKTIELTHPITGKTHTLYFQDAEIVELPMRHGGERSLFAMQAVYETVPALPEGDSLSFNSTMQSIQSAGRKQQPASSFGIIGGAFGLTAVFVSKNGKEAAPMGRHGFPLNICFSVPGFRKEDVWHFTLDGINIQHCASIEIDL